MDAYLLYLLHYINTLTTILKFKCFDPKREILNGRYSLPLIQHILNNFVLAWMVVNKILHKYGNTF